MRPPSLARLEPLSNKSVEHAVTLAGSLTKIKAPGVGAETATVGRGMEAINHRYHGSGVYLAGSARLIAPSRGRMAAHRCRKAIERFF